MAKKADLKVKSAAGGATRKATRRGGETKHTRPLKGLLTRKILESQARKVVLFVSTGNTCRSPMAAAYLNKLLEERKIRHIEVRSAGVMTIPGLLATDESKLMLEPYGISLERHRSQPLTDEIIRRANLILGMTPFHVQMALRMSDAARNKTHLFKEFTKTDPKGRPIPDPMGCTLEVYKKCFRQIKQACDRLVEMPEFLGKPSRASRSAQKRKAAGAPRTAARKTPARNSRGDKAKKAAKSMESSSSSNGTKPAASASQEHGSSS